MGSGKAFDLIKRLATDGDFRKRLKDMSSQGTRTLLATEGFADVVADEIRAAMPQPVPHLSIAARPGNAATGVIANASAGFGAPASTAAGFSVLANASAGFSAPASVKVAG